MKEQGKVVHNVAILATVMFRIRTDDNWSRPIRAICDTGAQVNLMTNKCMKEFGLMKRPTALRIKGVNESQVSAMGEVLVELWHRTFDLKIAEENFTIVRHIIGSQPLRQLNEERFVKISEHDLADPAYATPGQIEALFGVQWWSKIIEEKIRRFPGSELMAQQSRLGWLIFGAATEAVNSEASCLAISKKDDELERLIQRLWEIDDISA